MTSKLPFSRYTIAGGLIFTSGQIHLEDGVLVGDTVTQKTKKVMENVIEVLADSGTTLDKAVKATIYVIDMGMYGEFNEEYVKHFKDTFPAREVVCVKELPLGASIEISMIAKI